MRLTISAIAACVIVFFLQMAGVIHQGFAFMPALFKTQPYTLITSMFMHGSVNHLLFNMIGLFTFGFLLEATLSKKKWIILYFSSGFIASFGYALLSASPFIPAVGASGAIFGLIGGLAILKPRQIIYTMYGPIPIAAAAVVWGIIEFLSMFRIDNIAHSAHLFGLVGGVIVAYVHIKNINWKYMLVLIIIPPLLLTGLTWNHPASLESAEIEIPDCYVLVDKFESVASKAYFYKCEQSIIFEYVVPTKGGQDMSIARNVPYVTHFAEEIHKVEYGFFCNAESTHIDGNLKFTEVRGSICDKNFVGLVKQCKSSKVLLLEITQGENSNIEIKC